jgi:uncharacterized protein (DUF305 family)
MQNKNIWIVGIIALVVGITFSRIYDTQVLDQKRMYGSSKMNIGNMHKMPNGSMMSGMSMNTMMAAMTANLQGKSGKELEKAFLTEMIPHHQGAVTMAKVLLVDKTISPQLRVFAENIISAQEGEIKEMQEWLKSY